MATTERVHALACHTDKGGECTCGYQNRVDALRYRWLRHRVAACHAGGGSYGMVFPEIYGKRDWMHGSVAQHLDEAIDTLIAQAENC